MVIRSNAKTLLGNSDRTGCIFGFTPARSIDDVPDEKLFRTYDERQGLLTAKFTTSGDVCDENLPFDKADEITGCKRVQA